MNNGRESVMIKKLNAIEVEGCVDTVYTTESGMVEADPNEHEYGWEQVSRNVRIKVERINLAVHDYFYGWRRVEL